MYVRKWYYWQGFYAKEVKWAGADEIFISTRGLDDTEEIYLKMSNMKINKVVQHMRDGNDFENIGLNNIIEII